ncbi:MAG: tetratricopeptide repeat protein [Geminicoccaceae bacterium]|nr:tetratricopeptide repeat protein [Geminicoccaceae bacterium]MDW8368965.1 tetratricopeptide repeat protein [Geminicoccaceae bacterium]
MRYLLLLLVAWLAIAGSSRADQTDPRLDFLFARLKEADAVEARIIESHIWTMWSAIDDPEARDLLERGSVAMANRDHKTAMAAFDALTARFPNFAEGWNKRATLFWIMGDDLAALRDIQRTLALEPRHFGALSGLGLVLMRLNQPARALAAFEAALAIHPNLPAARHQAERLRRSANPGEL